MSIMGLESWRRLYPGPRQSECEGREGKKRRVRIKPRRTQGTWLCPLHTAVLQATFCKRQTQDSNVPLFAKLIRPNMASAPEG